MENQNTTPNEPQNDIYELLRKVVETNEESIKSTKQTELGVNNLLKLKFPFPSIEKQKEIVLKIKDKKNGNSRT